MRSGPPASIRVLIFMTLCIPMSYTGGVRGRLAAPEDIIFPPLSAIKLPDNGGKERFLEARVPAGCSSKPPLRTPILYHAFRLHLARGGCRIRRRCQARRGTACRQSSNHGHGNICW